MWRPMAACLSFDTSELLSSSAFPELAARTLALRESRLVEADDAPFLEALDFNPPCPAILIDLCALKMNG